MPWVKIDDGFYDNPTNRSLGPAGRDLFVAGLTYCAKGLTDGRIDKDDVPLVLVQAQAKRSTVQKLVQAGRWVEHDDHYEVVEYLTYQPSKAQVLAQRERDREKKRRQRKAGTLASVPQGTPEGDAPGGRPEGTHRGSHPLPDPTRPLEVLPQQHSRATPADRRERLAAAARIIGERAAARPGVEHPERCAAAVARAVVRDRHADAYQVLTTEPNMTAEQLADHLEPPEPERRLVLPPTSAPETIADFERHDVERIPPEITTEATTKVASIRSALHLPSHRHPEGDDAA